MFIENHSNSAIEPTVWEEVSSPLLRLCAPSQTQLSLNILNKVTQSEQPPIALAWVGWCQGWSSTTYKKIVEILDESLMCVVNKTDKVRIKIDALALVKCTQVVDDQSEESASLKQLEYSAQKLCVQLDVERNTLYNLEHEFKETGLEFCAWHWRLGTSVQSQNDTAEFLHTTERHLRSLTGWERNVLGLNGFCGIQLGSGTMNGGGLCTWDGSGIGGCVKTTTCLIDYLVVENHKARASALMHEWAHGLDRMLGSLEHLQAGNKVTSRLWCMINQSFCKKFTYERIFRPNLSRPYSPAHKMTNPSMDKAAVAIDTLFKAQSWSQLDNVQRTEKTKQWVAATYNMVTPGKRLSALQEMWDMCMKHKGSVDHLPMCVSQIFTAWPGEPTSDYMITVASAAEAWIKTAQLICSLQNRKKVLNFHPYDIVERLIKNMTYAPQDEKRWRTTTLVELFARSFERYSHPEPTVLFNNEIEEKLLACDKQMYATTWRDFFNTVRPILNPHLEN